MASVNGEIWRLTNASGQITYRLNLIDNSRRTPMLMQLISIDGVSINVPAGTPAGTVVKMGGNKFLDRRLSVRGRRPVAGLYHRPSHDAELAR